MSKITLPCSYESFKQDSAPNNSATYKQQWVCKVFIKAICTTLALITGMFSYAASSSDLQFEQLGDDFIAMYKQADPFDDESRDYVFFKKDEFTFRCDAISFESSSRSASYDSFSFEATIALKIDSNPVHQLNGTYSTHSFGSDLVNDDRVYSADITPAIVSELSQGNQLQASGKFGDGGWKQHSLDLTGFASAYDKVCSDP